MIDDNVFKKIDFNGSKGFIFIGEKLLVYRRDSSVTNFPLMIDLPGGGKEGDETPFETFTREAKEEFGIEVKKENIVHSKAHQSIVEPWKQSYFFVAKLPASEEKNIVFGTEGTEFYLLEVDDYLNRKDIIDRHRVRLMDYLSLNK
jgi:8-oxo-dGTP diphosphatase